MQWFRPPIWLKNGDLNPLHGSLSAHQSHHLQFHCRPVKLSAMSLSASQIKCHVAVGQSNPPRFHLELVFTAGKSNHLQFHWWRPIKSPAVSLSANHIARGFTVSQPKITCSFTGGGQSNRLRFHCQPTTSPAVSLSANQKLPAVSLVAANQIACGFTASQPNFTCSFTIDRSDNLQAHV